MTMAALEAMPINQITARIAAAHRRLLDAIDPLSAVQLTAPVLGEDGWSVKDVLAHLAFWDRRLLHAIEPEDWPEQWTDGGADGGARRRSEAAGSRLLPPPIADIPYDEGWLEAVNTRIYAHNRERALADVLAEFATTRARLLATVASLSPDAVFDPEGLSASLGEPFAPMLLGAYEHYEEHAEELEASYPACRRLRGNFIVTAQVTTAGAGGQLPEQAGWLARRGEEEDAPFVYATVGSGPAALRFRRTAGGAVEEVQAGLSGADVVQLERRGAIFLLSAARFGEPFAAVQAEVPLGDELDVGLVAAPQAGGPAGAGSGAVFRNVRVVKPAAPGFDRSRDPFGSRLEVLDVHSGERKVVYEADYVLEAPNWTRAGEALVYNSGGRLYRFDLTVRTPAPIDTGEVVRNNNDHVLSFDGTMLAISSHDEQGDSQVYTVPLAGGQPRRVTAKGPSYLHGWSPDGRFLVYTGYRDRVFDIYRIGVEGGEETRLTASSGLDDGPEYTPDGQYIYFNSTRSGRMQIWRMRADGSEQEQVTDDECDNWFPHVSPDGRSILFLSYLPGEVQPHEHPPARRVYLRLMASEGGASRVVAYLYGGQGTINVPSWSPDGRRVAFVSNTVPLATDWPAAD